MSIYRYTLRRQWNAQKRGTLNWVMLNPSMADDIFDDPTIRKCIGFTKRWGFSGLVVTNLFAYRATDPRDMIRVARKSWMLAEGEENRETLLREADSAEMICCAWGNNGGINGRDLEVVSLLHETHDLYCIRRTKEGNPVHPVRESYTDAPVLFYSCVGERKHA